MSTNLPFQIVTNPVTNCRIYIGNNLLPKLMKQIVQRTILEDKLKKQKKEKEK